MGDDRTVANAARVSFDKRTEELDEKDERLIAFLAREGHDSPFRHASLQFELYAPLMIARQWWKYAIGSDHVIEEFYIPKANEWRSYPDNMKQGSGEPFHSGKGQFFELTLQEYVEKGEELYQMAIERGVAPEQARLFLPAYSMYVR